MTADITFAQAYAPYGTNLSSAGDSQTPYGFTGEITDATGNIYLRARYYNPNDGRFLTKDPSRLESNLYLYAMGNPVNRIDPTGLFSTETIVKNIPLSEFDLPSYPSLIFNNSYSRRERWG
ncbi:MAG: RHS repeat-associated core domain-containing protein, partial [Anaerolineales bacterium]